VHNLSSKDIQMLVTFAILVVQNNHEI